MRRRDPAPGSSPIDARSPRPARSVAEILGEALFALPNVVKLIVRLLGHPEVPMGRKVMSWAAVAYVVSPIDIIPDFIPTIGKLDDVLVVAYAIARLLASVGPEVVAEEIGRQVGVDDVRSELLPEDKMTEIAALAQHHGPVAMVGDGVNDAPALAASSLGIAMGAAATDAALETAEKEGARRSAPSGRVLGSVFRHAFTHQAHTTLLIAEVFVMHQRQVKELTRRFIDPHIPTALDCNLGCGQCRMIRREGPRLRTTVDVATVG